MVHRNNFMHQRAWREKKKAEAERAFAENEQLRRENADLRRRIIELETIDRGDLVEPAAPTQPATHKHLEAQN